MKNSYCANLNVRSLMDSMERHNPDRVFSPSLMANIERNGMVPSSNLKKKRKKYFLFLKVILAFLLKSIFQSVLLLSHSFMFACSLSFTFFIFLYSSYNADTQKLFTEYCRTYSLSFAICTKRKHHMAYILQQFIHINAFTNVHSYVCTYSSLLENRKKNNSVCTAQ